MRRSLLAPILVAGSLVVSVTGASAQSPATVFFDFRASDLSPLAASIIQRYASGVQPGSTITVVGHSDSA